MRRFTTMLIATISLLLSSWQMAAEANDNNQKIRFVLDWKYQSLQAPFFIAAKAGYFAQEGLDVTIDQGNGSAATVTSILGGAYDAGVGDINTLIQSSEKAAGAMPVMVYMIYNKPPFAVAAKADGPVKTLKDLEGRTVGGPAGSSATMLFPLLAKKNHVDVAKVKMLNMAANLQENMLIGDQVDGILVFNVTSFINFGAVGLDPLKDIRWISYGENGIDLYGNGVMVSRRLADDHPDAVKGLVRAINRGMRDALADPEAAVSIMIEQEPLLNADVELRRWRFAELSAFRSPEVDAAGLGDVNPDRLKSAIEQIGEAFELKTLPEPDEVFDRSFLPARFERSLP